LGTVDERQLALKIVTVLADATLAWTSQGVFIAYVNIMRPH